MATAQSWKWRPPDGTRLTIRLREPTNVVDTGERVAVANVIAITPQMRVLVGDRASGFPLWH